MTDKTGFPSHEWPPEGVLFPVTAARLRVFEGEHPFHVRERAAIDANWDREVAANPAFFNGRMVFQKTLKIVDGAICGEACIVPYSAYLWWRRQPVGADGYHLFGFPALATSDGALVAIRMAGQTANPGKVYFAAGSLDEDDVIDGYCDIDANMRREVREELGLDLDREAVAEPQLYASHNNNRITIYRIFRFSQTAEELVASIRSRPERDDEIEDMVIIRSPDPTLHDYGAPMLPFLSWFFRQV